MKKIILSTSLLAFLAGTSIAGGATLLTPTPAEGAMPVNSTCTLWGAFKAKPQALTVDVVNAISAESDIPNLWGPRFTWSMYTPSTKENLTHEFNAGLGLLWGSEHSVDLFEMPMSIGYNAVYALSPNWDVYAGGKLTMSYVELEDTGVKDKDALFSLSFCTGIRRNLSEDIFINLGYEYKHSFANISANNSRTHLNSDDIEGQHVLSLGVGYKF